MGHKTDPSKRRIRIYPKLTVKERKSISSRKVKKPKRKPFGQSRVEEYDVRGIDY